MSNENQPSPSSSQETERALRAAAAYAESIVNTVPDALLVLEADLRVRTANDAFYQMFGMGREETEGRFIYDLDNRQWDIPELHTLLEDILPQNNAFVGYEVDCEFESIGRRTLLLNGRQLGHIPHVLLVITDITERKEAEEALRTSKERLQKMINIEDIGVLIFHRSGRLTDANDAFLQMFGYSRAEVEAGTLTWRSMTPPEYMAISEQQWQRLEETGRIGPYEKEYLCKDGSRSWMLFVGASMDDGTLIEYCIDVNDRKRAEEALRRVNEELEERVAERTAQVRRLVTQLTLSEQAERRRISAILHDDLQQRLFSLQFQLKALGSILEDGKRAQATLAGIQAELHHSIQIIRQLSVDLSPPVLHNEGLAEAVIWLASQMEQQHGLAVTVRAEANLPRLGEDQRVLVFQIVREMLFNVVKHAGVLEAAVTLTRADGTLQVEVSDRGAGFAVEEVLGATHHSHGLDQSRRRLALIDGQLAIDSTPGAGTRITIACPLPAEGVAKKRTSPPILHEPGQGEKMPFRGR